jgi:hypothetical protein
MRSRLVVLRRWEDDTAITPVFDAVLDDEVGNSAEQGGMVESASDRGVDPILVVTQQPRHNSIGVSVCGAQVIRAANPSATR